MIDKKFEKAKKLLEFLNNQEIDMVISGDYDKLNPEIEDDMDYKDGFNIVLDNIQIGFSFDKDGNFEGIYNWK
jgi:hypothetical protein